MAGSAGCRHLISMHNQIPKQQAFVFNTIDMAVSLFVTPYFMRGVMGAMAPQASVLAARTISFLSAAVATAALVGPINLSHAVALSLSSLAIGFLLRLATIDQQNDSLYHFVAV